MLRCINLQARSLCRVLQVCNQVRSVLRLLQAGKHHLGPCSTADSQQAALPYCNFTGRGKLLILSI